MLRGLQITSYQGPSTGLGGGPATSGGGGQTSRVLGPFEEGFLLKSQPTPDTPAKVRFSSGGGGSDPVWRQIS